MRRFDKKNNIRNANLLAEQRYLASKGLINENDSEDWELEDRKQQYGINPEIEPLDMGYTDGIGENEISAAENSQSFIPNEIFQLEQFEMDSYDIVKFNYGYDDSILEIEYTYTETDNSCFYLKAIVSFYFKISGEYRPATWGYNGGSPEEYPEEEFIPDIVELKYIDCNSGQEYKLTDEMNKIAIPNVFKTVENLENDISEKLWSQLDDDGPDGDY
jgi:hypothetical protein